MPENIIHNRHSSNIQKQIDQETSQRSSDDFQLRSSNVIPNNAIATLSQTCSAIALPTPLLSEKIYPVPILTNAGKDYYFPKNNLTSTSSIEIQVSKLNETLNRVHQFVHQSTLFETISPLPAYNSRIINTLRKYFSIASPSPHLALNNAIDGYNKASYQLKDELANLVKISLDANNPSQIIKQLHHIQIILAIWERNKETLHAQLAAASKDAIDIPNSLFDITQRFEEETSHLLALFDHAKQQATPLEALSQEIQGYKKCSPHFNSYPDKDFIWLIELQHELAIKNQSSPTSLQLSEALTALLLNGSAFPKDVNCTLALLEKFFPNIAIEQPELEEENINWKKNASDELHALAQDQALSIQLDNNETYEKLYAVQQEYIEYHSGLNTPEQRQKAQYRNLLTALYKNVTKDLETRLITLKKRHGQHLAQIDKKSALLNLKHYYELASHPLTTPLSAEEYATYTTFFTTVDDLEIRLLLIQQLKNHYQPDRLSTTHPIATPSQIEEGHLLLLTEDDSLVPPNTPAWNDIYKHQALENGAISDYLDLYHHSQTNAKAFKEGPDYRQAAHACLYKKDQLKIHQAAFNAQHIANTANDGLHKHINLLEAFEKAPIRYRQHFEERTQYLIEYKKALLLLIEALPPSSALAKPFQTRLAQTSTEIILLTEVLNKNTPLTAIENEMVRLEKIAVAHNKRQIALSQLETQENIARQTKSQFNLSIYQLRCKLLELNIEETRNLCQELKKETPISETALLHEFSAYFENQSPHLSDKEKILFLVENTSIQAPSLQSYRHYVQQTTNNTKKLERLQQEFRIGLLALQKEERCAQKNGGYPSQLNWSDWLKAKLPGKWSEQHRQTPQQLVLAQQLALHGKNLLDAFKDLAQALKTLNLNLDFTQDLDLMLKEFRQRNNEPLQALGLTPSQLFAWSKDYPTELQQLATNLNHLVNLLTRPTLGTVGLEAATVVKDAFERATLENTVKEMLLGYREDIPGIIEPRPLPTPLIALLYAAEYAPYGLGAINAANGNNLASYTGDILGKIIPIPGASGLFKVLAGVTQVQIEKDLTAQLSKRREMEVTINALLMGLNSYGGISERIKAIATYKSYRDIIKEGATTYRDIFETKPRGFFSRIKKQLSLWWKHTTPRQKITLIASAIITPIVTGAASAAIIALKAGTLGLTSLGIAAGIGVLGGTPVLIAIWSFFSKRFGLTEVRKKVAEEITDDRIEKTLNQLRNSLSIPLSDKHSTLVQQEISEALEKEILIFKEKLRSKFEEFIKINGGSSKLTEEQKNILKEMIIHFKTEVLGQTISRAEQDTFDYWINRSKTHFTSANPSSSEQTPLSIENFREGAHMIDKQLANYPLSPATEPMAEKMIPEQTPTLPHPSTPNMAFA